MRTFAVLACVAASAIAHAQYSAGGGAGGFGGNGGGYGNNADSSGGTTGRGGAGIARVEVGPNGFNPGLQGLNTSGGGGLFGVTRRTHMGEANSIAAHYFQSAGVRLNPNAAGFSGVGATSLGTLAGRLPAGATNLANDASPPPAASGVDFADEAPAASSTSTPVAAAQSGALAGNGTAPGFGALSGSAKPGLQSAAASANRNRVALSVRRR